MRILEALDGRIVAYFPHNSDSTLVDKEKRFGIKADLLGNKTSQLFIDRT
jgi:hypothetical protein